MNEYWRYRIKEQDREIARLRVILERLGVSPIRHDPCTCGAVSDGVVHRWHGLPCYHRDPDDLGDIDPVRDYANADDPCARCEVPWREHTPRGIGPHDFTPKAKI